MRVLWITNKMFPEIGKEIGTTEFVGGGWMFSLAKLLAEIPSIELAVAGLYKKKGNIFRKINKISYFLFSFSGDETKYNKQFEKFCQEIDDTYKPDIVHIHGTEFPFGLAYIKACSNKNVVISIQGLVSIVERYYYAGMSCSEILRNITFRDIIRRDNLFQQRRKMKKRGMLENEYIKSVDHIIGRTSWDKAHVLQINPKLQYHFCNETLREDFYLYKWQLESCEKHSVFVSQAAYPIKGVHQILKALPIIIKRYPDTKLYVGGADLVSIYNLKYKLKQSGYAKYVHDLINELDIADGVIFTGPLGSKEMCNRYLKSHVFVCPSSIENSSNSLGEAQILGVPCIASYVGGMPDMIKDRKSGLLYRFEEFEMLADAVCRVFDDDNLAELLSLNGRQFASERHSSSINLEQILKVYNELSR